jgi:uncharacterized protein YceK
MTLRPLYLAALVAGAAVLSGCGKTGELEQPAPLYGAQAKADYDAKRAAAGAARAHDAEARRASPHGTPLDPTNQPPTQAPYAPPLPGRTDPFGGPPAGGSYTPDR